MKINNKNHRGSALIIAMLVASVVFNVGAVNISISEKDILRQVAIKESTKALNVLDTAWECVLYHDFPLKIFRSQNPDRTINCGADLVAFKRFGRVYSETEMSRQCDVTVFQADHREIIQCNFLIRDEDPGNFRNKPCARLSLEKTCSLSADGPNRCGSTFTTSLDVIGFTSVARVSISFLMVSMLFF